MEAAGTWQPSSMVENPQPPTCGSAPLFLEALCRGAAELVRDGGTLGSALDTELGLEMVPGGPYWTGPDSFYEVGEDQIQQTKREMHALRPLRTYRPEHAW